LNPKAMFSLSHKDLNQYPTQDMLSLRRSSSARGYFFEPRQKLSEIYLPRQSSCLFSLQKFIFANKKSPRDETCVGHIQRFAMKSRLSIQTIIISLWWLHSSSRTVVCWDTSPPEHYFQTCHI
jgi:hypothetical protein